MKKVVGFALTLLVLGAGAVIGLPQWAKSQASSVELPPLKFGGKTVVFAQDDKHVLGNILPSDAGKPLTFEQTPELHRQNHMAAEDRAFYEHDGVSTRGLTLAMITNAKNGSLTAGGGTITGQYVRNAYLTHATQETKGETAKRKVLEWKYAYKIEQVLTKNEIITNYLNTIYYGCGAYGIDDAARAWFGVSATEIKDPNKPLDVARAAFLAALIKSPSTFDDPGENGTLKHEAAIVSRQKYVLDGLTDLEGVKAIVSPQAIEQAKQLLPLKVTCNPRPSGGSSDLDPYLLAHIQDWLAAWQTTIAKENGLKGAEAEEKGQETAEAMIARGGLHITLAINHMVQAEVENAAKNTLPRKDLTAGVIMLNPFTGGVVAMYGGAGQNNALFAQRQPGSLIKAVVLANAVSKGISPQSEFNAPPFLDGEGERIWNNNRTPVPGCKMTLADALAVSHNIVYTELITGKMATCPEDDEPQTVSKIDDKNPVTPASVAKLLREMGGELSTKPGQTNPLKIGETARLAIGDTVHMSPLQVASVAATLAGGGVRTKPYIVKSIKTSDGKLVYEHKVESKRVLEEKHVRIVSQALTGVFTKGTARDAQVAGHPLAGKTGSTPENAWIFAYPAANPKDNVPDEVCAAWGGFHESSRDISGILSSAQMAKICQKIYTKLLAKMPTVTFPEAKDEGVRIGAPPVQPTPSVAPSKTSKPLPTPSILPSTPPKPSALPSPTKE
ncbi:MAG TPA: transglycosylase domain-containing protein [Candidatus Saccharimonadales bacterium]|nr:transglycosylase domain-containing protein [Candidatus Saccharimonadales bacterium]